LFAQGASKKDAMTKNAKTSKQYWDNAWMPQPRMRLPSGLLVGTRNVQRLLKHYVTPGMQVLEIGCAPGKILAWVAKILRAEVSGVDFSARGIDTARRLFQHLSIAGDLRCEDVFETSFKEGSFDCVFSCGMIEHFNDPKQLVEIHVKLLKSLGKAFIMIPNFRVIYGRIQRYLDPDILALHNLDIMSPSCLVALSPMHLVKDVHAYPFGRPSAMFTLNAKMPKKLARALTLFLNVIGHLQPCDITALCPLIVLEMTRKSGAEKMYDQIEFSKQMRRR
jgi:2-polyprenyl-3-methyl-5-hydroxy-6-metoxy-1,4-benzoquinol methylase